MSARERIHRLMGEVAPLLDLGAVYGHSEANRWVLTGQDRVVMFVELTPDESRLWLSAEVGTPSAHDRAALYQLMLRYNAQWQKTGGVRLVLNGPEGAVVQAYDLPEAGLDVPRLCTVIRNFRSMLDGWRTIVAGGAGGGLGATAGNAAPVPQASGMIRG